VAAVMQVTPAYLSSVATFYDMLRTRPTGSRYIYVCTGVACHPRDAKAVYEAIAAEASEQGLEDVEIREFECLGACDMAPMASVDGRYVGPLQESDAPELVSAVREGRVVLPDRGLADLGYRVPPSPRQKPGPPEEPDVHPAGGTWKDAEVLDVPPAEGEERP
jgi:NADH-quinone oxidoreductase subunit E